MNFSPVVRFPFFYHEEDDEHDVFFGCSTIAAGKIIIQLNFLA